MSNGQGQRGVALASPASARWHEKFTSSLKGEHILGLTNVSFAKDRPCSACITGKLHEKAHKVKTIITTLWPLELIHLDLFGPPTYDNFGGRRYCLVIIDDFTRYTWVFFLKTEDETQETFINFAKEAQR